MKKFNGGSVVSSYLSRDAGLSPHPLIISLFVLSMLIFPCLGYSISNLIVKKEYWDNGKIRAYKVIDEDGDIRGVGYYRKDGSMEQNEKYDRDGKKIEESYYGENGRLEENADGWAAMRNIYENGKLAMENYYGMDGKLKERKEYNELGDLVVKQYVGDSDPMPEEEFNPTPTIAGETIDYYDSYGRPEGETRAVSD